MKCDYKHICEHYKIHSIICNGKDDFERCGKYRDFEEEEEIEEEWKGYI